MQTQRTRILLTLVFLFFPLLGLAATLAEKKGAGPSAKQTIRRAVNELLRMQEDTSRWSYEALHTDPEEPEQLPLGFQVGGTSIVGAAPLLAAPDDEEVLKSVRLGLKFVLKHLKHPKMAPSKEDRYDVRIWGHGFALEFLCHVRARKAAGDRAKEVDQAITSLVKTIVEEEIEGGGWNYSSHSQPASFVTGAVVQALLWAHSQGEKVPDEVFERTRKMLEAARRDEGAFSYGGPADEEGLAGSAGRATVCETSLMLLGGGSVEAVQLALENFYKHWDDLEERRQKPGTHEGKDNIAPYYFYYGHRFASQTIQLHPKKMRAKERRRLLETILKTRDEDGTWNDRAFERDRNVGTAFMVLAMLGNKAPVPPKWTKKK